MWLCIALCACGGSGDVSITTSVSSDIKLNADDHGGLAAAVTAVGSAPVILVVSSDQTVLSSLTVPSNITLQVVDIASITVTSGTTLTINGPFEAGLYKVFTGDGAVTFGSRDVAKVHPEWWGAKRDGTSDDTGPVQAAINALSMGGEVAFVNGTYVVDSISLASNISINGSGQESVIEQKKNAQYCCSINPGNGGTVDPKDNKRKIQIRNIHFRGTVAADGFSEHIHLLNINAATDVTISDCWFSGWRGDGIYLGSSNLAETERHNKSIVIKNCSFDGMNNDNRNAISVIDGDGVEIDNNSFTRCTRSNMPGAIDLEPDPNRFSVIQNISITRNKFDKIGGSVGIIALVLPLAQKDLINPSRNILIQGNIINGLIDSNRSKGITLIQHQNVNDTDTANEITIKGNNINNTSRPFVLLGIKGVTIENNAFSDSVFSGLISNINDHKSQDVAFKNNIFEYMGSIEGSGITIFSSNNISFTDNVFDNIGLSSGTYGIAISIPNINVNMIRIENNQFKGKTTTHALLLNSYTDPAKYTIQNNSYDTNIKPVIYQ